MIVFLSSFGISMVLMIGAFRHGRTIRGCKAAPRQRCTLLTTNQMSFHNVDKKLNDGPPDIGPAYPITCTVEDLKAATIDADDVD